MVIYDARPSAFTQLSTIAEWEYFHAVSGARSAVDGPVAFLASFDVPGRNIVATQGVAAIKGQLWRADLAFSTAIPAASAQNRLDRLVLRYNRAATTSPTVIVPTVITGTPSGSPALPSLTQTATGIWDLPLCYWTSASSGALSGLTDDRKLIMNDGWHSISAPANFFGGVSYRMTSESVVMLAGQIQLATSGSYNNVVIATLPANYRPIGDKYMHVVCTALSSAYGNNSGAPGLPYILVKTDGTVQLSGFPGAINGALIYIDGCNYPLDF